MTKPISPSDIAATKKLVIPPEVIEAANELIALNYSDGYASFKLKDFVKLAKKKLGNVKLNDDWLNIEDIYRAEGWKVIYDQPAYCETYDAYFQFKKK